MATPSIFSSLTFVLLFLALTRLAFATFPHSYAASIQLDFWSKNVLNDMPESVLSKLSPLSKEDSNYVASLLSKPPLSFEAKFCSMANLACNSLQNNPIPRQVYRIYITISTTHALEKADPNSFFRLSVLKKGNKVQLPNLNEQMPPRAFLPTQIASKISTTSSTDLQNLFPESFTKSVTKEAIETSILYCGSPSLKGELKSCPNSLENMIEFSKKTLGEEQLIALTSKSTQGSGKEFEIGNIKQFHAEKVVSCHEIFFPFATYFCHLLSSTRLYAVDVIEPATKAPINRILAICHMDTSEWPAARVAFEILKSSPGQGEACHWFTNVDLVWMGNGENKF